LIVGTKRRLFENSDKITLGAWAFAGIFLDGLI
jgi:hypothetical protein